MSLTKWIYSIVFSCLLACSSASGEPAATAPAKEPDNPVGIDVAKAAAALKPATTPAATNPSAPGTKPLWSVLDVYKLDPTNGKSYGREFGLNDVIVIIVENLKSWNDAVVKDPKIVPYINGIAIKGNYPLSVDTAQSKITFRLTRTEENREHWAAILKRPNPAQRERNVEVSVGKEGPDAIALPPTTQPAGTTSTSGMFLVLPGWWYVPPLGAVLIILLLSWLAVKSDILRDTDSELDTITNNKGKPARKPYSLARFQMAWWFIIVIFCFVSIWMITGQLDSLPNSVLALIGISSGTAVGALLIDASKRESRSQQAREVNDARAKIANTTNPPSAEERAALEAKLADIEPKLKASTTCRPSESFIRDIVSDSQGVSLHRFQMFVWTLVLGLIFLWGVYETLAMPELSAQLLGLLGISAGTYLGFKTTETRT